MTNSAKAAGYIATHCPVMGRYSGDPSPHTFLLDVADEMEAAPFSPLLPERYKEHVAYAVRVVGRYNFREPPAAIAAVYLATRFEYFFRLLSGKLNGDGTWLDPDSDWPAAIKALGRKRLSRRRVCNVAMAYKLMKLDQSLPAAKAFAKLDGALFPAPSTAAGGFEIADIGDRIAFGRHSAGHGLWGDISSEAVFYALATAIVYYNQS